MAEKQWQPWDDECPSCGSTSEVFTTVKEQGEAFEGDEVRCTNCGLCGCIAMDDLPMYCDCIAVTDWFEHENNLDSPTPQ